MTHCTEDELILYYYDQPRRGTVARHLGECGDCASAYRSLAATLQLVEIPDVPERDESYPTEVWGGLRGRLPERAQRPWQALLGWQSLMGGAAIAALVVMAFVTGRMSAPLPAALTTAAGTVDPADAGARVRLAAIGDHLERSERVLLDLANAADDTVDLSAQQAWAADLVDSNRLYREAATRAGDTLVAGVLDDLERSLIDIVHGPSAPTPADLHAIRTRLDAAALLFKVRVLADELHEREITPPQPRKAI